MTGGYDAVVVGAGPNGLAAAIELARAGRSVVVIEGADVPGGGARTEALTLPGFAHDVCSAVHPLGAASPFFRSLPLGRHGLEWLHSPAAVAHPLEDGTAALLERSPGATAGWLGGDGAAWRTMMVPFVARWRALFADTLGPLHLPRRPLLLAGFGALGLLPTTVLIRRLFRGERARALFAGIAAHATLPLDQSPSAAFGLMLGVAGHAVGWPIPRGGSGRIASALVDLLRALGGEVVTGRMVTSLAGLPAAGSVLLDLTAKQVLRLGGLDLPDGYRRQLDAFRPGLGTFKVDWALDGPIPWRAAECARAATVHLGTSEEIVAGRREEWAGRAAKRPFVLLSQPTLFDPGRAPPGKHTAWGYCHVPLGSAVDMTERIEAQVERFAPGFRARILARHSMGPADFERHNPNLVGGDINGGESTLWQLFLRPAARLNPYTTPVKGVYLCSSSTPPGGAVHGMCGYYAARTVLGGTLAPLMPPALG
jgi:phytoene dehydrogenase-like protein